MKALLLPLLAANLALQPEPGLGRARRSHRSPDSHQQRLQLALCGGLGEFLPEQENVACCSPDLCNASRAQALQLAGVTWALLGAPGRLLPWGRAQL
ncbi:hypothetical protein CapIbe_012450 [Capra ibex]